MNKKSQITMFFIIGIFILAIAFLFYFIGYGVIGSDEIIGAGEGNQNVDVFIHSTLSDAAKHCLIKIGQQGGYNNPEDFLQKEYSRIEFAYNTQDVFLTQEALKEEIDECISKTVSLCINDFEPFKKMGYPIEHNDPISDILLAEEDTPIKMNFSVSVQKGGKTQRFEKFSGKGSVRLKIMHDAISTYSALRNNQVKSSDIDLSYLGSVDVNQKIYREKNNQDLHLLIDPKSSIGAENYFFMFSNRH